MPLIADIRHFFGRRHDRSDARAALPAADAESAVRSVRESAELLRRLVDSLESREETTKKAMSHLEDLPKAVESLGDLRRHAAKVVEAVGEHAESARQHGEAVESTLGRLHETLGGQVDAMVGATDRIEVIVRTVGGLSEEIERLRGALAEIAATGARSSDALRGLAESGRRREEVFLERVAAWQWWTTSLLGLAALGSLGAAIGVLIIALR